MKLIVLLKFTIIFLNLSWIYPFSSNLSTPKVYTLSNFIYKNKNVNIFHNCYDTTSVCKTKKESLRNGYWVSYYDNGNIKEEGHFLNNLKNGYWKTYYENGIKKKEGEYLENKKTGYWYFYLPNAKILKEGHFNNNYPKMWWKFYTNNNTEKCLYQSDGKTRYCLVYRGIKLIKGKKYINDTFVKEWNSLSSFKKDNPNFLF